jgi:RND family efflux transporter MFP subunit
MPLPRSLFARLAGGASATLALSLSLALPACGKQGGDAPPPAAGASPGGAAQPREIALAPENVAVVEERALSSGPAISGTLRARRLAALRAEVPGTVVETLVEAGERVKEGQALARISAPALLEQAAAARAAAVSAESAAKVAEADARRARTLAAEGAMSAAEAERAELGVEAARAQLAEARSRVASAEEAAGKTRVRAPFAGVIAERQVSGGDVVAPGAPLFTVIDPSRLQLDGAVPAARLGEARPGTPVEFTVTGFGDRGFQGRIERVNPVVDPATGQVRVYVDVPNEDGTLISGLYAQGRIAAERATALAAPVEAVDATTRPPSVVAVEGGRARRVPVELGLQDEAAGAVALLSGVEAGDVLVLGSARALLQEGAPVRIPAPAPRGGPASATGSARQGP